MKPLPWQGEVCSLCGQHPPDPDIRGMWDTSFCRVCQQRILTNYGWYKNDYDDNESIHIAALRRDREDEEEYTQERNIALERMSIMKPFVMLFFSQSPLVENVREVVEALGYRFQITHGFGAFESNISARSDGIVLIEAQNCSSKIVRQWCSEHKDKYVIVLVGTQEKGPNKSETVAGYGRELKVPHLTWPFVAADLDKVVKEVSGALDQRGNGKHKGTNGPTRKPLNAEPLTPLRSRIGSQTDAVQEEPKKPGSKNGKHPAQQHAPAVEAAEEIESGPPKTNGSSEQKTFRIPWNNEGTPKRSGNGSAKTRAETKRESNGFVSRLREAARSNKSVLLSFDGYMDETGQRLIAAALHAASSRAGGNFIALDAAEYNPRTFGNAVFGTGNSAAILEVCGAGTLFLLNVHKTLSEVQDELDTYAVTGSYMPRNGSIAFSAQARLVYSITGNKPVLEHRQRVQELMGQAVLLVPSLDDPGLFAFMWNQLMASEGTIAIAPQAYDALRNHNWRGNIKSLQTFVRQLAAIRGVEEIGFHHLAMLRLVDAEEIGSDAATPLENANNVVEQENEPVPLPDATAVAADDVVAVVRQCGLDPDHLPKNAHKEVERGCLAAMLQQTDGKVSKEGAGWLGMDVKWVNNHVSICNGATFKNEAPYYRNVPELPLPVALSEVIEGVKQLQKEGAVGV